MTVVESLNKQLFQYEKDLKLDSVPLLNTVCLPPAYYRHSSAVQAHQKTGQPRIYILLGGLLVAFLLVVRIFGMNFVSNIIGLSPCWKAFKALRSSDPHDDTKWLIYFVAFGFLSVVESVMDLVLWVIPFYHVIKVAFLFWASWLSNGNGALLIYNNFAAPILTRVEVEVEKLMHTHSK